MVKVCTKCKVEKPLTEFRKRKDSKDGLRGECKPCLKKYLKEYREVNKDKLNENRKLYYKYNKYKICDNAKKYRQDNKDKISKIRKKYYQSNKDKISKRYKEHYKANKERINEKSKQYYQSNKDKLNAYKKAYREANKDKIKARKKAYYEANKDKINAYQKIYNEANKDNRNAYQRERRKTDHLFKLKGKLTTRTWEAFKNKGYRKNTKTQEMLGVDWEIAKQHIERQFKKGMNWENHGEWHIDHIIPLASAKTPERLKQLCHYTNLQPMWAVDNLRKSDSINGQQTLLRI